MTPKELFQTDKELWTKFNAVVSADWFKKGLAYAKAEMFENKDINGDKLEGARMFERAIIELATTPSGPISFPELLDHNVDNPSPQKPE